MYTYDHWPKLVDRSFVRYTNQTSKPGTDMLANCHVCKRSIIIVFLLSHFTIIIAYIIYIEHLYIHKTSIHSIHLDIYYCIFIV